VTNPQPHWGKTIFTGGRKETPKLFEVQDLLLEQVLHMPARNAVFSHIGIRRRLV
jgi:hypothetical protein